MTTIAYIRVSSDKQTCSNQHFTIKEYAKLHHLHIDKGVSQAKISKILGVHPVTLCRYLKKVDINTK